MNYRPEIDGLRALAVVPVILFHAGLSAFSGGFVGVDIFFVISGYLITTIIAEDLDSKNFSLITFYYRRAKRILPALFLVLLACIIFSWVWLIPSDLEKFSRSLIAVGLFVSNLFFWRQSDYFDSEAEYKPLLHTWSLSVEEQFYLIFPIVCMISWKFGRKKFDWILIITITLSFFLSEWGWRNHATANFYLAPTRAWELLIGALAAIGLKTREVKPNKTLSVVGFAAIIYSIFTFDKDTPSPSIFLCIPVLGTILIILFSQQQTFITRILSSKLFVAVGLISYPAYLWHQPIFSFARIRFIDNMSTAMACAFVLATFTLAYLTWKFIEVPIRQNSVTPKFVFALSIFGSLLVISIGLLGILTQGGLRLHPLHHQVLFETTKPSPLRSKCHFSQNLDSLDLQACTYFHPNTTTAVLGNSHGTELAYAVATELAPMQGGVAHHTMSGCPPNFRVLEEKQTVCYRWHEKAVNSIKRNQNIETVILIYRNENLLHLQNYNLSLARLSKDLISSGKNVILVLQPPLPGKHINKYIYSSITNGKLNVKGLPLTFWKEKYDVKRHLIPNLPPQIQIVDPAKLFCDNIACDVIRNGKALYFDDDHISLYGASIIAKVITQQFIQN